MTYLFMQTLFWIALAFLLGLLLGWLLCSRCCRKTGVDETLAATGSMGAGIAAADTDTDTETEFEAAIDRGSLADSESFDSGAIADSESFDSGAIADSELITDSMQPQGINAPEGEADDLKRISGVGPVIERTLNELGIWHFYQIADFSADNIRWVDRYIDFPGRIDREDWVNQAYRLAEGKRTEFAKRYDRGEVGDDNPNS